MESCCREKEKYINFWGVNGNLKGIIGIMLIEFCWMFI